MKTQVDAQYLSALENKGMLGDTSKFNRNKPIEAKVTAATKACSPVIKEEGQIRHWEQEVLDSFKKSTWGSEELFESTLIFMWRTCTDQLCSLIPFSAVINAAKTVLQIPGQLTTNFNVLYQLGYAYMRTVEYELASKYFMDAHHINS